MHGHWLCGTRKMNRHYQSGNGGGSWDTLNDTQAFPSGTTGNHYVGYQYLGRYRFNALAITVTDGTLRYFPTVLYYSLDLALQDLNRNVLTILPTGDDPANPAHNANLVCPDYGNYYTVWWNNNGTWLQYDSFTADFSTSNLVSMYGFTSRYGFISYNVCVYSLINVPFSVSIVGN